MISNLWNKCFFKWPNILSNLSLFYLFIAGKGDSLTLVVLDLFLRIGTWTHRLVIARQMVTHQCTFYLSVSWSSLVVGDQGSHWPKWQAVAFITLQSYRDSTLRTFISFYWRALCSYTIFSYSIVCQSLSRAQYLPRYLDNDRPDLGKGNFLKRKFRLQKS